MDRFHHALPDEAHAFKNASDISNAGKRSVRFQHAQPASGMHCVFSQHLAPKLKNLKRHCITGFRAFHD